MKAVYACRKGQNCLPSFVEIAIGNGLPFGEDGAASLALRGVIVTFCEQKSNNPVSPLSIPNAVSQFLFLLMSGTAMVGNEEDKYTEGEARRRFEAAIRAALSGPAKPHSEMKLGKPRAKPRKSPGKRKAVKK